MYQQKSKFMSSSELSKVCQSVIKHPVRRSFQGFSPFLCKKKSVLVSHGVRFLRCTFQSRRYVVHIYINAIAKKPYSWSRYFKYSGFTIHFGVKWFMQSYFYDLKLSKTNVGNWSQCTFDDYFLFHQYTFISSMFDWCYTNLQVVKWK